jgi:hypothetical protein
MVSQRPFPRAISLLRRQQKTYDAQATGLDLHNRSGSKEMEKGTQRSRRDSRFLQLRNVTTSCEELYPGGQGGWRRNSRARSAAPDRNRRLSGRRFADSRSIQHRHAAERPHLQPDASHPPWLRMGATKEISFVTARNWQKDFHPWAGLWRQGGHSLRRAGLLQIDSIRCGSSLVRGHTWRFEGNELRMDLVELPGPLWSARYRAIGN